MKPAILVVSLFMILGVAAAMQPAGAQMPLVAGLCGDHDMTMKLLEKRYGEHQVATGLTNGGALFELLSNRSGSTWSVLVTKPGGVSCIVALGSDLNAKKVPADQLTGYRGL